MSFNLQREAIATFLRNTWPEGTFGPLVYPNMPEPRVMPGIFFCSYMLIPNEGARVRNSIGAPRLIRNYGFIYFTTYIYKDGGTKKSDEALEWIANTFDEKVFALPNGQKVVCGIGAPATLGLRDNLFRNSMSIPYHRDEWPQTMA